MESSEEGEKNMTSKTDSPPAPPNKNKPYWDADKFREWGVFGAEIIGLLGLFYYACTNVKMWHEMQAQTEIQHEVLRATRDQFQTDQRPHISIIGYEIGDAKTKKKAPVIGHPLFITVFYKNVGKSVALNVIYHRHLVLEEDIPKIKVEPVDTRTSGEALDVNSPGYVSAVSIKDTYANHSIVIPESSFIPWNGLYPVVIFGRISYEDSFGNKYCTPISEAYMPGPTLVNLNDFGATNTSVKHASDLCPSGKP